MTSLALRRPNWASELLSSSRTYYSPTVSRPSIQHSSRNARPNLRWNRWNSQKGIQQTRTFGNSYVPRQTNTAASKPATPGPSAPKSPTKSTTTTTSTTTPAPKPTPPSTSPSPSTYTSSASSASAKPTPQRVQDITKTGLDDKPASDLDISSPDSASSTSTLAPNEGTGYVDWTRSYHGLSAQPFSAEAAAILLQPVNPEDVEIKPDGIVYLPEIKYRRILNRAFGPGGWGLVPRSESIVTAKSLTREYALLAHGRLVSIARGEQDYFSPEGIPTATEGCKSNAMMRCCKDLGVASELWDPRWIRKFKAEHARDVFVEHMVTKRKSKIWIRKGDEVQYPWKMTGGVGR